MCIYRQCRLYVIRSVEVKFLLYVLRRMYFTGFCFFSGNSCDSLVVSVLNFLKVSVPVSVTIIAGCGYCKNTLSMVLIDLIRT